MQPAATSTKPKKKTGKWLKGALYTAFALAVAGYGYRDYQNTQLREEQQELIQLQDDLIEAQGDKIKAQQREIEQGGSGGYCDDGFIIPDLKQHGPIQVKASKPAPSAANRII